MSRPRCLGSAPAIGALALCLVLRAARAAEGDAAAAEALFQQGKQLLEAGNVELACPKLAESYRLDPATGALLALAVCYETAGKWASAWAAYVEVVTRAGKEGRRDRASAAQRKAKEIEPKLSRLIIELDPETAALAPTITRDGTPLGPAAVGVPLPVDPGEHVVEVSAPGKITWRGSVSLTAAGEQKNLRIPRLNEEPRAPAPAPAPAIPAPAPAPAPARAEPTFWTPLRIGGAATAGAGAVGLVVGGIFAVRAAGLNTDSKDDCDADNVCGAEGKRLRDDAGAAADVATVAFLAGGALAIGGTTLFVLGSPKSETHTARAWITFHPAGISLRGSLR